MPSPSTYEEAWATALAPSPRTPPRGFSREEETYSGSSPPSPENATSPRSLRPKEMPTPPPAGPPSSFEIFGHAASHLL
jgi:hypothetical protein